MLPQAVKVYSMLHDFVGAAYDILVGHGHHISQVHFEGTNYETVRTNTTGTVVGVDFYSE